jgi:hypothetical protein
MGKMQLWSFEKSAPISCRKVEKIRETAAVQNFDWKEAN